VKAIFLDRDGVINENRADHVTSWAEFRFIPGALEALRLLTRHRFAIFVVTNQAIVNKGLVSHGELAEIHRRMGQTLRRHGARLRDLRYCPHRVDEGCACRKPRPGMVLALARKWGVDLGQSFMIGDAISDLQAGQAAGCHTAMVLTGRGAEQAGELASALLAPPGIFADLWSAVHGVLDAEAARAQGPAYRLARPAPAERLESWTRR
jgi:D-glycero-D-manno-heptose 1,7-bisphosphate phosphatase